ncbi:TPA: hypothetical protein ACXJEZ_002086 [Providencia rettgeri]
MRFNLDVIPLLFSVFLISSCGDSSDLTKVKNHVFEQLDNTRSIGNVMEHRESCNKYEWNEQEDNQGRKVVTFTCYMDYSWLNKQFNHIHDENIKKITSKIESLKKEKSTTKSQLKSLQSVYDLVESNIPKVSSLLAEYKNILAERNNYYNENDLNDSISAQEKIRNELVQVKKDIRIKMEKIMIGTKKYSYADSVAKKLINVIPSPPITLPPTENEMKNRLRYHFESSKKTLAIYYDEDIEMNEEKLAKIKDNPIIISEMKNIIEFSSNPSELKPVSVISSGYYLINKGEEMEIFFPDLNKEMFDIYSNTELKKIFNYLNVNLFKYQQQEYDILRPKSVIQ